jgi:hypothetical protein
MPTAQIEDWGDAVFVSISNALNTFLSAIPQVIGALLIILIGWLIAGAVARLVTGLLRRAGADRLMATHGSSVYGERSTQYKPSTIVGEIVKWIIRFVFLVAAANVLGMTQVSELLNQVLLWIPNLLVAAVILLVAPVIARFVRGTIEVGAGQMGFTNARLLGQVAEIAIVAFAVIVAINQIGIAANLVNTLFIGFVAALALAFGLAFGLGGREVASQLTQEWYRASRTTADKVKAQAESSASSAPAPSPTAATQRQSMPARETDMPPGGQTMPGSARPR